MAARNAKAGCEAPPHRAPTGSSGPRERLRHRTCLSVWSGSLVRGSYVGNWVVGLEGF